jgi:glycosyltransferase involved in cell wall biosynthesis
MNSPFDTLSIQDNTEIILVSDLFSTDINGGAELTTEAIFENTEYNVQRIYSKDVTIDLLEEGYKKYWIFTNFSEMNLNLIPTIIENLKYSVIEYDYKFCKYRSIEKHVHFEGIECNCHKEQHGQIISRFYHSAKSLWFMSEGQRSIYEDKFAFIKDTDSYVLSSVFNTQFFNTIEALNKNIKNNKYVVLNARSWIKDTKSSINWCKENNEEFELVSDLSHKEFLTKLSKSKGIAYFPSGNDTCPRMIIEAKLLGCKIQTNDNVQHKNEAWFSGNNENCIKYLQERKSAFWKVVDKDIENKHTISGYTTTLNCIDQKYPFEESILSLISFCDQVIVLDGGSNDGTFERLIELADAYDSLQIHVYIRDWNDTRFALHDGAQKAAARELCSSDFCWQQDVDEIVHEDDGQKIKNLVKHFPNTMDLIALPVVEFWGSHEKVRVDVNPWKWRLSKNKDYITHGIPKQLRQTDSNGKMYSLPGSDGCDYIRKDTGIPVYCGNFYNNEMHETRIKALSLEENSIERYQELITKVVDNLPGVFHYSWFDLERKIKTYKNYWTKHWQSMYNIEQIDTAENNMFFDKKWEDVTDKEIADLALQLKDTTGGWIFHNKVDFNKPTPHIKIDKIPKIML